MHSVAGDLLLLFVEEGGVFAFSLPSSNSSSSSFSSSLEWFSASLNHSITALPGVTCGSANFSRAWASSIAGGCDFNNFSQSFKHFVAAMSSFASSSLVSNNASRMAFAFGVDRNKSKPSRLKISFPFVLAGVLFGAWGRLFNPPLVNGAVLFVLFVSIDEFGDGVMLELLLFVLCDFFVAGVSCTFLAPDFLVGGVVSSSSEHAGLNDTDERLGFFLLLLFLSLFSFSLSSFEDVGVVVDAVVFVFLLHVNDILDGFLSLFPLNTDNPQDSCANLSASPTFLFIDPEIMHVTSGVPV
jgi:hypothetical protein